MKKGFILTVALTLFFPLIMIGQDIIVKQDGTTIMAKVIKIGEKEIEYKKYGNLNGPIYTIGKEEVQTINYPNGDIDRFSNMSKYDKAETSFEDDDVDINLNNDYISRINNITYRYIGDVSKKNAKYQYRILHIHKDSKTARKEAVLYISPNSSYTEKFSGRKVLHTTMQLSFSNTSDKVIYIDLANCFFKSGRTARVFYTNTSIMTTSGKNAGAGVNLGAIAGGLGIGGVAGSIANGVTVGGGISSSTSVITHSERIIAVAPHTAFEFPKFDFYNSDDSSFPIMGDRDSKVGSIQKFSEPNTINDSPWCIFVTYSYNQDFSTTKNLSMGLYVSDIISLPGIGWNGGAINTQRYFRYDNDEPHFYIYKTQH